ncbi:MAG: hypothetical protein EOP58_00950 [Sphingomonadales bacterium]|nr:MAG: hypothetical protein EOP58_00950 [Sphingomonadales bacterium]
MPSAKLVVATVANVQGAPAYALNRRIVDALVPAAAARRSEPPAATAVAEDMAPFTGQWTGAIEMPNCRLPIRIELSPEGSWLALDGAERVPLTETGIERGILAGKAETRLEVAEAKRWPHALRCHLEPVGQTLEGTVAAYAARGSTAAGPPHDMFWLSFAVRLWRSG